MTIIGAKQIKGKWNLFSDDAISLGDYSISASSNYRRKIREIPRAPHKTYVASSGTCRQTDFVINFIDKYFITECESISSDGIKDLLQLAVYEAVKKLKEIDEDSPSFILLILDTELNQTYLVETFSVIALDSDIEYTGGSGDVFFYSIHKTPSALNENDKFIQDFRFASKSAPGCGGKVFQVNKEETIEYPEV